MDTNIVTGLAPAEEPIHFMVAEPTEREGEAQKENAPEFAALEASVAFATVPSTTEYTTEEAVCQVIAAPTLEEIEAAIADVARQRIGSAQRELAEIRDRIERERVAHENTLEAMQERVIKIQAALDGLAGERGALESRARAFLGGAELDAMLGKIHLAFNARQLELEDALATTKTDEVEVQAEIQTASVSDALGLQLAEQDLERLESLAPEVAQAIQQAAAASQMIATAHQAIQDNMLRDAATLIDQAKKANADSAAITELEEALVGARKKQAARDLIARLHANLEQPGALRHITQILDEATAAGLADQVTAAAAQAHQVARHAANERFAQARPIADHLVAEGFVPVVGDGRIEAWKPASRNSDSVSSKNESAWTLDHVLVLRAHGAWVTEKPRVSVTRKTLTPRVTRSRWYRAWASNREADAQPDAATDQPS